MHIAFAVVTLALSSTTCGTPGQRAAITAAVKAHQPGAMVSTITIAGDYADATVIRYGDIPRDVLLAKRGGAWKTLASSGSAYNLGSLERAGIPPGVAAKLWKELSSGAC